MSTNLRQLRDLLLDCAIVLPAIFGPGVGTSLLGEDGVRIGQFVGCVVSYLIFWILVTWNPDQDFIQSMAVMLSIPFACLLSEIAFKSHDAGPLLVAEWVLLIVGACIYPWAFSRLWIAKHPESKSAAE